MRNTRLEKIGQTHIKGSIMLNNSFEKILKQYKKTQSQLQGFISDCEKELESAALRKRMADADMEEATRFKQRASNTLSKINEIVGE